MEIIFTNHAENVITERNILKEWVVYVIYNPVKTENDKIDTSLIHNLGKIQERGDRILRVIRSKESTPVKVVTTYFDRNQKRKL